MGLRPFNSERSGRGEVKRLGLRLRNPLAPIGGRPGRAHFGSVMQLLSGIGELHPGGPSDRTPDRTEGTQAHQRRRCQNDNRCWRN